METNTQVVLIKFTLVRDLVKAAHNLTALTNPEDQCTEQLERAVEYLNDMLVDIESQGIEPFGDIVWDTLNGLVCMRPTYNIDTHTRVCALLEAVRTTLHTF